MTAPGLDEPYFEREHTLDLIENVAAQKSLVIYAGAGVSIDRTNITWPQLIERLMANYIPDYDVRKLVLSDSPLQSASILKQIYINLSVSPASVDQQIAADVHRVLYSDPERELRRAGIARAIVRLIAELGRQDKKFYVITTNYDDCLQKELEFLRAKSGPTALRLKTYVPKMTVALADVDKEADKAISANRIVHLHGYIPEPGRKNEGITLSEVDYAAAYPLSSKILERLFNEHPVLILGSSLTDPPLVNALANSKRVAARKGLPRIAVVPVQGFSPVHQSNLRAAIRENVKERMEHFDVDVTFPDMYSQVAQFVTEVQVCFANDNADERYRDSPIRYGSRLRRWWAEWESARAGNWSTANERDHRLLKECAEGLKGRHKMHDLSMEIEVWIHWKPESGSRQLRLWASSKAAWPEIDARTAEIAADSPYVSVQTFANGRIDRHPPSESSGRRRRYLCVPIKLAEQEQLDLPVGVISLAYSLENGNREPVMAKLVKLAEEVGAVGRQIAGS